MQGGGSDRSVATERVIEVKGRGPGATSEAFVNTATEFGLTVVAAGPNRFRVARSYRPGWAVGLAIVTSLCVGLGLLFLLVKRTESADAVITEDRTGVRIRIVGNLSPSIVDRIEAAISVAPAARGGATATPAALAPNALPGAVPTAPYPAASPPPAPQTFTPAVVPVAGPMTRFSLVLADGRRLPVANGGVIGRNPRPDLAAPGAALVPIDDPSLSKTHLSFGPSDSGVWLVDLHSTNGTHVVLGSLTNRCEPGQRITVPAGAVVMAGDVRLTVVAE
jgi:hypothetical protein